MPKPVYSVIWKYSVKPGNIEVFEREYGFKGSWYKLFSDSEDYAGSFLHKSETEPNIYLLIDTWSTKQAYEKFIELKRNIYDALSKKFEYLYVSEERIGSYVLVLP